MRLSIVGATGLVGTKLIKLIEKRQFPVTEFYPVASEDSEGKIIKLYNHEYITTTIDTILNHELDIIFFCSSNKISEEWIPKIFKHQSKVKIIDNSSFYRLNETVPLVIPEINSNLITADTRLIANPNCSTAQLAMVLYPLDIKFKIKRVVVSTYQSVSGSGYSGIQQMHNERARNLVSAVVKNNNEVDKKVYTTQIDLNCISFCDILDNDSGYTKEELKLEKETKKIIRPEINLTATAVRVPVLCGHCESVNIEFEHDFELEQVKKCLEQMSGVEIKEQAYPLEVLNQTNVWVSRIRRDYSQNNSLNLWIVADNLMKGAALNAIQIAEHIINLKV
jgi:aspartate-semialdehyde dehydrogenase